MEAPSPPSAEEGHKIQNQTPFFITSLYSNITSILAQYGWFILAAILVLAYLKQKFDSRIQRWLQSRIDRQEEENYDSDVVLRKQEAMELVRQRMQQKHDSMASDYLTKQSQLAEEKRKKREEDWENHKQGKGYRSKIKMTPNEEDVLKKSLEQKRKKPQYRPSDYNPLLGHGSSGSSYRPSTRGGGSGGG